MDEIITFDMPAIDWRPGRANSTSVLDDEIQAFDRLLPELLLSHRGQYVAVFGGKVVGSGVDLIAVAKQAYAEYGYRPILVRLVTDAPPRVVRIPSLWRVRG